MPENSISLNDCIAILRRRKIQIIVPLILILMLSAIIAFSLPPVYRSTATIRVEQQEVPPELIQSTVTSYASERIRAITEFIMTRSNLLNIIEKYDLYPQLGQEGSVDELISRMRRSIDIIPVNAEIVERRSGGRSSKATIAFEISFESNTPESAQRVTEELVSLFLQENSRLRTQSAESTKEFLAMEAARMRNKVSALEEKLSDYKERNVGRLPELFNFNLELANRAEEELDTTQREISTLEERKAALLSQLSQIDPYSGTSPQAQLRELQTELLEVKGRYAPGHPDRVRLERKIGLLKKEIGDFSSTEELERQAKQLRAELETARTRYSEQHPDVVKLERALAAIESGINEVTLGNSGKIDNIKPDNPAYISIQSQLESINIRLQAEKEKKEKLKKKIIEYRNRIEQMPRVEQEGLALKRDYENAVKRYNELQEKLLRAQIASELEQENKGETFSVLDSPVLPQSPHKPNRLAILLIGVFFSVSSGLGYAGFTEYLDPTVRGIKGVNSVLQATPLVAIPYIHRPELDAKQRSEKNRKRLAVIIVLFCIVLLMVGTYYYGPPIAQQPSLGKTL